VSVIFEIKIDGGVDKIGFSKQINIFARKLMEIWSNSLKKY
jgi:hypothetical protein